MDQLVPLSTDDACHIETDNRVFETRSYAANRCAMHDKGTPKDTTPFLKSNYKYKRRVQLVQTLPPEGVTQVIPRNSNSLVTEPEQLKTKHSRHLRPPLIDSYFKRVAVGFIASVVIIFRDILLNSLKRVAREWWRVWCINSNKIHQRLSKMSGEVKKFATDGGSWRRYAATAAIRWSKSSGLECFSISLKLIYLTLFIALWMTVYEVEAGTCWMERADNGKCKNIFSSNMTKTECCRANQMHSYSEEDLSNVEHFFVLALGGGKGCSPCFENCKDVVCGPNKRCVKRKGRPKCICSPQCGTGKKHNKKAHKRKQHQQQTQHQQNGSVKSPHVIDVSRSKEHVSLVNFHSPITVRDVRSLSSEIHSNPSAVSAMILTSPGDDIISQSNSRRKNQRIPTNPTKKQVNQPMAHQHRPNHQQPHHHQNKKHHKQHQQQQQELDQEQELQQQQQQQRPTTTMARRRHANTDRNKGDKIIITADDRIRPSTERDSDLPESNSLGDSVNRAPGTGADTHQAHQQQSHGQHGRHHMKKHAKPKRKIADHNSVYNGTATMMTTTHGLTMAVGTEGNRGKMKQTERRLQRPQSFDVALPTSFASAAPDQQRTKKQKPSLMHHPSVGSSGSANNRELHLGQDYVDDLTFDDKIHNEFFSNGFPYAHQELSPDEDRYNHPVCGSDGRTYNTECQLKKRACRTDNHALVVAYRGHCQTSCKEVNCLNGLQCVEDHYAIPHCIVCSIQCPFDDAAGPRIDPARAVCGVDGNTYKSTCDINRMVCKIGRSIAVAYQGPCREDRASCSNVSCGPRMTCLRDLRTHQPRCVTCRFKCPRKRRQSNLRYEEGKLCGSNNRTYHSWCEMKKDSCSTGFYIDFKSIGNCKSG